MRYSRILALFFAFLCAPPTIVHAQGAGIEWETLIADTAGGAPPTLDMRRSCTTTGHKVARRSCL